MRAIPRWLHRLRTAPWLLLGSTIVAAGCEEPTTATVIARFRMNDREGLLARGDLSIDNDITADGAGSLHIVTTEATVVPLYDAGDLDIEDGYLLCDAHIRLEGLVGEAYLELLCHFAGRGEYFSRGLDHSVEGTTIGWQRTQTGFFLREGENPDGVRVNLVITGPGQVWLDDIRLIDMDTP